jgi:hypothetical protein
MMTAQQKHSKSETLRGMFLFQRGIFENALDGLSDVAALKRISDTSNHMNWLLGHIVHCRFMLAGIVGIRESNPFGNTYWSGIEEKAYPNVSEVVLQMNSISEKLMAKLASLSDEALDATLGPDQPVLGDVISFFSYHEAYHLGQVGMVRKLVGLGSLKSN